MVTLDTTFDQFLAQVYCVEFPTKTLDGKVNADAFFADFSGSDVITDNVATSLVFTGIVQHLTTERLRQIAETKRVYIVNAYSIYFEVTLPPACMKVIYAELAKRRTAWR